MGRIWLVIVGHMVLVSCTQSAPPRAATAPPTAVAPVRGAAGNADLRVLLSDLASSKACDMIRGAFQGLRAPEHPDVVNGVLWVRECEITNVGAHVAFHLTGNGWLWVDQTKGKAGGTFTVRQYVRFSIATTIKGGLDIFYNRDARVVTLWFTPDHAPDVEFKTIGAVSVDSRGVWSSAVGALGSALSSSPEDLAQSQATAEGTKDFNAKLAEGLAVTINLCTGLRRVHFGRPPKGEMGTAGVGETLRVAVGVQPSGVMIIGPQSAEDGLTLQADASQGAVRLTLVCAKNAETVAAAFMDGRVTSDVPALATVDVRTTSKLELEPTTCPVVIIASALGDAPARFAWERPASEIALSTGGPLVQCQATEVADEAGAVAPAEPAARNGRRVERSSSLRSSGEKSAR